MNLADAHPVEHDYVGASLETSSAECELIRNPEERRQQRHWLSEGEFWDLHGAQRTSHGGGLRDLGDRRLRGAALRDSKARQRRLTETSTEEG